MEKLNPLKKIFNKFYYELFIENFKEKVVYDFPQDYFRWDLIDYLIKKYDYKDYLEIGCDRDQLFSRIKLKNKIGVDPYSGGNVRKTSDDFFLENNKSFDLVFIDGLHTYAQVKKDILNSVKFLNTNGIILVHDCLPDTMSKQAVPRYKMQWNGDVWKAIVDLRQNPDLDIYTCEMDQGIGIIKKRNNTSILKLSTEIEKLKFKDYFNNYKEYMRVINLDEFKKKF
ncbi:class I SAM-dependent methyltransferase [Candidatus Pelagibacter sp. HIMB1321]|uniref:class I SAM-dependent methyltransferase n=1 Tax=Candidatus Pelagibacter sp. HIMB1321 TaxID=1388755 RepID=UPI000A07EEBB|nr:class I SAM-dependent methyltransferase [Candidatus Pelagibacter sp. HIMB1321]SMF76798.1 Predicted O-methyltransferase [Candidatus Pelagibacter sp. HIMB1321]